MIGSTSEQRSTIRRRNPKATSSALGALLMALVSREPRMPRLVTLITHTMARTCSAGNSENWKPTFLSIWIHFYLL